MAKSNQGGGGLHSMRDQFWRDVRTRSLIQLKPGSRRHYWQVGVWQDARDGVPYSVNTTDCTLVISKRFRQRMFLQANKSSLRIM